MTLDLTLAEWLATLLPGAAVVAALGVGALLLARRSGSRAANRALGGLLIVAGWCVLYVLLLGVQPPGENLRLVFAPLPYTLALGPLLYAYVRARLGDGLPHPVHAALPLAQAAILLGVGLAPEAAQRWWMGNVFAPWYAAAQVAATIASLGGYLWASWRAVRAHEAEPYEWARRRDAWLRRLLAGVTAALVVLVLVDGLDALSGGLGVGRPLWLLALERAAYGAVLFAAVGAGLVQAGVRLEATEASSDGAVPARAEPLAPEAEPAAAPSPEAERQADALRRHVEAERPFLDPDLSLGSLAAQIGLTDKALSALLNETMGTTYTAYVNGLRVREARQRLRAPEHAHLSVLAVGLDSGFASKSTFNRVFKEATGQTPSAYRASGEGVAA